MIRDHFVYRAYDCHGRVLYVGCTKTPAKRQAQHERTSAWYQFAVRFVLTGPFEKKDAYAYERRLIAESDPAFNLAPRYTGLASKRFWMAQDILSRSHAAGNQLPKDVIDQKVTDALGALPDPLASYLAAVPA